MGDFLDLSKFTKQNFLGKGSFGKVFKVVENETGKVFAAKISLDELTEEDKSLLINIKREVGIISQLNHPSILKFIGYSPINFKNVNKPVIIVEYSSNGSLRDLIMLQREKHSPPEWNDTKKLITLYGISSAMSYLHSHNIIHRDLKPGNVLEDDYLFPKICDFGYSKIMHNPETMTTRSSTGMKGTATYLAPECWEQDEYTKSSDVYSFAILAYELLTLEIPFFKCTDAIICRKVTVNGERPQFNCPINEAYVELIKKCWSQEAKNRPTFDQIKEDLKNNKDFITENIDADQFYEYVKMIDDADISFDPSKKFTKILIEKDSMKKVQNDDDSSKIEAKTVKTDNTGTSFDPSKKFTKTPIEKDSKKKAQNESSKIETRTVKIERKKIVEHASPHALMGISSHNHTHYTIYHITRTEQRKVIIDAGGNKFYSEWTVVPGSEKEQIIKNDKEVGFTEGYEKIIL